LFSAFPTDAESKLVDLLRANGKAIVSLVAVEEAQVVGHILFSPVSTSPLSESKGIGLAPVGVQPYVQSQGIGSQLIREGFRRCKEFGYDYCVVLGDPEYYSRFDLKPAALVQNEYGVMMSLWLSSYSALHIWAGKVCTRICEVRCLRQAK
jgi:putative acetyltransferase